MLETVLEIARDREGAVLEMVLAIVRGQGGSCAREMVLAIFRRQGGSCARDGTGNSQATGRELC